MRFVDIMKKFIAYLQLQGTLINQMKATCPQLSPRWLIMEHVCKWLLDKHIALFEYIDTAAKPVTSAPPNWWWIIISGIKALTELINPIFIKLQAPDLLVSVQAELLDSLTVDVSMMLGISSWEAGEGTVLGELCLRYGRWCVDYAVVHKFLQGLGMYTWHMLEVLDVDMTEKVLESIGKLGVRIVDGIVDIQAERNEQNHADSDLPSILPHELVKMSTGDFGKTIVDLHLQQLWHSWSEESIVEIENE